MLGNRYNPPVMKKTLSLLALCAAAFTLNSCCAFINGQDQDVNIRSNVPQTDIFINGIIHGSTPGIVTLERDETYDLELRKEGYYPHRQKLDADFSGWFAGNLIFGGLLGMIIDLSAGTCWSFDDVQVNLTPIATPQTVTPTTTTTAPTAVAPKAAQPATVITPQQVTTYTPAAPTVQQNNTQVIRPQRTGQRDYLGDGVQNLQSTRDNVSTSSQPMDGFFDSVLGDN